MTSPRSGVVRESMLMRPSLTKAQSRGPDFTLDSTHISGREGVAEVLSSWRVQNPHRPSAAPSKVLDFVSLNRDAVRSGLVTAKEIRGYRTKQGEGKQAPAPKTTRAPVAPDIIFGAKTRPSSPLADLLSHQYARSWREQQLDSCGPCDSLPCDTNQSPFIPETRTTLLRKSAALTHTHTPVRATLGSEVPPSLQTFRRT